jgi:hypothetical protein
MEPIDTERVEVRIIEHATGLLRTANDRKRRGCITHSLMLSLQGARAHKNLSFAKPGRPTNSAIRLINVGKVALLTPPVFLPTGNSLVSYVWQRGPAQAQRSRARAVEFRVW